MEDRTDHALSYDLETFEWPGHNFSSCSEQDLRDLKNSRVPIQYFKMATSVADDKTQFFYFLFANRLLYNNINYL